MSDVLENLARVLEARKEADPETSYVASLHAKGLNKILEKVGEECTETLLPPRTQNTPVKPGMWFMKPPTCGSTAW